jgi:hypothetical protein
VDKEMETLGSFRSLQITKHWIIIEFAHDLSEIIENYGQSAGDLNRAINYGEFS